MLPALHALDTSEIGPSGNKRSRWDELGTWVKGGGCGAMSIRCNTHDVCRMRATFIAVELSIRLTNAYCESGAQLPNTPESWTAVINQHVGDVMKLLGPAHAADAADAAQPSADDVTRSLGIVLGMDDGGMSTVMNAWVRTLQTYHPEGARQTRKRPISALRRLIRGGLIVSLIANLDHQTRPSDSTDSTDSTDLTTDSTDLTNRRIEVDNEVLKALWVSGVWAFSAMGAESAERGVLAYYVPILAGPSKRLTDPSKRLTTQLIPPTPPTPPTTPTPPTPPTPRIHPNSPASTISHPRHHHEAPSSRISSTDRLSRQLLVASQLKGLAAFPWVSVGDIYRMTLELDTTRYKNPHIRPRYEGQVECVLDDGEKGMSFLDPKDPIINYLGKVVVGFLSDVITLAQVVRYQDWRSGIRLTLLTAEGVEPAYTFADYRADSYAQRLAADWNDETPTVETGANNAFFGPNTAMHGRLALDQGEGLRILQTHPDLATPSQPNRVASMVEQHWLELSNTLRAAEADLGVNVHMAWNQGGYQPTYVLELGQSVVRTVRLEPCKLPVSLPSTPFCSLCVRLVCFASLCASIASWTAPHSKPSCPPWYGHSWTIPQSTTCWCWIARVPTWSTSSETRGTLSATLISIRNLLDLSNARKREYWNQGELPNS